MHFGLGEQQALITSLRAAVLLLVCNVLLWLYEFVEIIKFEERTTQANDEKINKHETAKSNWSSPSVSLSLSSLGSMSNGSIVLHTDGYDSATAHSIAKNALRAINTFCRQADTRK